VEEANELSSPTSNAQTERNISSISQEENDSMRNEALAAERKAMDAESTTRQLTESVDTLRRNAAMLEQEAHEKQNVASSKKKRFSTRPSKKAVSQLLLSS